VEGLEMNPEFWRGKRVLVTGHTGFKGSWLSLWLQSLQAQAIGYSLPPPTEPSLFVSAGVAKGMESIEGSVLDVKHLRRVVREHEPEIMIHMAAQSLVRRSYTDPSGTYATNVMGTVNVLEVLRDVPALRSVVVVTTDKCYENRGEVKAHREDDSLGGDDPYSSSKAAAELVAAAYRRSFFATNGQGVRTGIATARAGNVIGGGDWAEDRIIPDVMRAVDGKRELLVRNPDAVRPWQHVLDPLCGYLMLAEKLWKDPVRFGGAWNFGPDETKTWAVGDVLRLLQELWGNEFTWRVDKSSQPHESRYLKLDSTKARTLLGWQPKWDLRSALAATVNWFKAYQRREDLRRITLEQMQSYQRALRVPEAAQI
jgi:CDP-glucose 4,6-dehydratase